MTIVKWVLMPKNAVKLPEIITTFNGTRVNVVHHIFIGNDVLHVNGTILDHDFCKSFAAILLLFR